MIDQQSSEYRRGRNGEVVIHAFNIEHGYTTFDVSGTAHDRAPLLHKRDRNIVAPDAFLIRERPVFGEYKTKTEYHPWRGGNRQQRENGGMPAGPAHGINRHQYPHYRHANEKVPVTLWFLTLTTGMLHVASLDELGEPYPSVRPDLHDVVNWPLARMHRVVTFNPKRLRTFVNGPLRENLLTEQERKKLFHWLHPVQLEFDPFVEHFLTMCEHHWASRGSAA